MTKQDRGLAGHPALSKLQLMGTAMTQAVGDMVAEDHPSLLPRHHPPFLPLVMWLGYTRVSKEDGAQGTEIKMLESPFF